MIYKMKLADSVDEMIFDLLEVPIEDKDIEGTADNTTIDGNVFTDYLWLKKQFVQKWSLMCEDDYTQLRGFYTRQWENAEVPTYKLFVGENRSETLTASGSAFQIQNGTQYDAPLTLTELTGNATQNGTPTPDAPVAVNTTTGENVVKITGKNLFDKSATPITTSSGVSVTEIPTGIKVSDVNGNQYRFTGYIVGKAETYLGKTFTLSSIMTASGTNTPSMYIGLCDSVGQNRVVKAQKYTSGSVSYTVDSVNSTSPYIFLAFYANAAGTGTANNYVDFTNVQLELGSTATTYEGYRGTDYEVNLGKNLLPFTDQNFTLNGLTYSVQDGSLYIDGTSIGEIYSSNNQFKTNFAFALGAGTYILSLPEAEAGITTYIDDTANATHLATVNGNTIKTATFTLTQPTAVHLGFYVYNAHPTDKKMLIQLERGTATTYAPYFTPIELCKIGTYQDYIWNDNGTWKVHKAFGKIIFDGTQNVWISYASGSSTVFYYELANTAFGSATLNPIVSDNFRSKFEAVNGTTFLSGSTHRINFCTNVANNPSDWVTWLTSHHTTVYYAYATPTDTAITESALITQLDNLVSAELLSGVNNIMLVGTGAHGEIGVEYTLTYEKEQVIIPETPVRLNLTDGGVINTCGCRQNVQLTMRETVQ